MQGPHDYPGPYEVEVDDHSEDCGTVYRLKGPNVSILSKDEEELKYRAADFNLGFEQGQRSMDAAAAKVKKLLSEVMAQIEELKG